MMKLVAGECKIICLIEFSVQIYTFQVFYAVLQYCCAWLLKPLIKVKVQLQCLYHEDK